MHLQIFIGKLHTTSGLFLSPWTYLPHLLSNKGGKGQGVIQAKVHWFNYLFIFIRKILLKKTLLHAKNHEEVAKIEKR